MVITEPIRVDTPTIVVPMNGSTPKKQKKVAGKKLTQKKYIPYSGLYWRGF
jgi:hypothetical protein